MSVAQRLFPGAILPPRSYFLLLILCTFGAHVGSIHFTFNAFLREAQECIKSKMKKKVMG
jgi:hypothetical protein